jgi:hypothetical protein
LPSLPRSRAATSAVETPRGELAAEDPTLAALVDAAFAALAETELLVVAELTPLAPTPLLLAPTPAVDTV